MRPRDTGASAGAADRSAPRPADLRYPIRPSSLWPALSCFAALVLALGLGPLARVAAQGPGDQADPPAAPFATPEPRYPATPEPKDRGPEDEDDEEDEAPQPAAATPSPARPGFVLPARTQRPTRTPRATALPSPTPLAAGGLRLSFSAAPAVLVLRETATFTLELVNQGDQEVGGLVIDVVTPDVLIDFETRAAAGTVSRAGGLLAWHLGRFGPGERATLSLQGRVARAGSGRSAVCATLISSGSAIEHCAAYPVQASAAPGPTVAAPAPADDAVIPEAPSGSAALRGALRPGLLAGFALLGLGLFGLAYAWSRRPGEADRGRSAGRNRPAAGSEEPSGAAERADTKQQAAASGPAATTAAATSPGGPAKAAAPASTPSPSRGRQGGRSKARKAKP